MESHPLRAHPAAQAGPAWQLEAGVRTIPGGLSLRYCLAGDIARLRHGKAGGRVEGLWKHTCFEAFLQPIDEHGYLEFNFSPAGAWAAYRFGGRRAGRKPLELPRPPLISVTREDRLETSVQLLLPPGSRSWRAGLSAVLEDDNGCLSYWALAHAGPQPDFHDPAGFLLEIQAP